ncbi:hypothetical protein [Azospirillum sp.]|uniref:hypothetical protein n=1 Tax=Azospirillum sp. TaxID=34012 RepID=UPI003D71B501
MPPVTFRIGVEVAHLIPENSPLTGGLFPTLSHAVAAISAAAHRQWVQYASGMALPDGKVINPRTGEYARSIQLRQLGDFSAEVYTNLAYAAGIEHGMPARDLKRMLDYSLKVRLTKDGRRYLIIPFRWNNPNSVLGNNMPQEVHDWWHGPGRTPSAITGVHRRLSGTGAYDIKTRQQITVPARTYSWGSRMGKSDLAELGVTGPLAKRMEGMVNFRKPNARGGAAHSKFMTFRVMIEGSPGWKAPAVEGKWPARTVAQQLQPVAEQAFGKAIEEDVKRLLGG